MTETLVVDRDSRSRTEVVDGARAVSLVGSYCQRDKYALRFAYRCGPAGQREEPTRVRRAT